MRTRSIVIAGVLILGAGVFFARNQLFPSRVPPLVLDTAAGDSVSLRDLDGKEGVLLYVSSLPGDQHVGIFKTEADTWKAMQGSARYKVILVFGASDETVARTFAAKAGVPVLLDPGKKLADKLGFTYLGIVFYKENGKIVKKIPEGYLRTVVNLDDHFDVLRGS